MDSPGKNPKVGCHFLLQGILPTQGLNPCLFTSPALAGEFFTSSAWEEKAMATHSSALAWKIPWAEEPGRLQSMGLLGVGHD